MNTKVIGAAVVIVVIVVVVAAVAYFSSGDDDPEDTIAASHETQILTETDSRLWIVGNANLDDVLDEQDIEYIQAIIDGEAVEYFLETTSYEGREAVSMADANADGVVDEKDIEKVRSMIDGEEQIIYYVDVDGIRNSVHYPVESIIPLYYLSSFLVQILDRTDMVIACDQSSESRVYLNANLAGKGVFDGTARFDPDPETILSYNPDIVLTGSRDQYCVELEASLPENRDSIDIVRLSTWEDGNVQVGLLTLAFMLDNMEKGLEYIEWSDEILDIIEERTSTLSDDEKVTVIVPKGRESSYLQANALGSGRYETSVLAGVINISDRLDSNEDYIDFDEEWLYNQTDLDFIIYCGYDYLEDPDHNKDWNESMVEHYSALTAAYGTEVHTVSDSVMLGPAYVVGVIYIAKIVYPDLFEDLDADALFQEFVDTFMVGWEFDVAEYNANGGGVAV